MIATHLIAGARSGAVLVRDDADRLALLELVRETVGQVLAYCVMDTQLHVVIEGDPATTRERAAPAFRSYTRSFNTRHGFKGTLLRGRPEPFGKVDSIALAKAIDYVHENPISTKPPIVPREVDFEWSSARAFTGLARDRFVDPDRARVLLGVHARRIALEHPELAGLEQAVAPCATPARILSAAAATLRVLPADMASARRSPELAAARAIYVTLGRLESYCDGQLARPLGRSRTRTCELSADPDMDAVQMARTLLRDPGFATRIRAFAGVEQGSLQKEMTAV
jgi:hypothetical protein